jgi:hypothetical protein
MIPADQEEAGRTCATAGAAEVTRLAIVARAIANAHLFRATYNRGTVTLAPYLLYERDEALFVDALTVERDGRPPREVKLGTFRLSGLRNVAATAVPFRCDPEIAVKPSGDRWKVLARTALA